MDGNNVGGWHWQEKNLLPWSRQKIDELVRGLCAGLDASLGSAEVLGIKELTGEVCAFYSKSPTQILREWRWVVSLCVCIWEQR